MRNFRGLKTLMLEKDYAIKAKILDSKIEDRIQYFNHKVSESTRMQMALWKIAMKRNERLNELR